MKATPESILSLAARTATRIGTFGLEQGAIDGPMQNPDHPYWQAIEQTLATKAPPNWQAIEQTLATKAPPMSETEIVIAQLEDWKKFYKNNFNLDADFSGMEIPGKKKGFDRLIVVAQGLTLNQVFDACRKHFPCYRYTDDLDTAVPTNDRTPTVAYAIWVRERVEADKEHKNRSADDLKDAEVTGITLLERMLFELKYFLETGKHLDIENVTLCAGSRCSGGDVPYACWDDGGFYIGWYCAISAFPNLRCREVVTL